MLVRLIVLPLNDKVIQKIAQEVEGRLFSEGLHVLGQQPRPDQMKAYLSAYFGPRMPERAVDAVVAQQTGSLDDLRQQLERSFAQVISAACWADDPLARCH